MSSNVQVNSKDIVWLGKPWVTPAVILRTVALIVVSALFVWLEIFSGAAFRGLFGLPVYAWTLLVFVLIWAVSILQLLIFRFAHTYILRQDGLEIKQGILRLNSFVVTPSGFGDMIVNQGVGGRIFGYGNIIVNSQGERMTKLFFVRGPSKVSDTLRDILGKPIVRVEGRV
jgi:hypothetical protein